MQEAAQRGGHRSIRVWSAACSTGEEPYTIVITLLEALEKLRSARRPTAALARHGRPSLAPDGWKIEVIASDIDTHVLGTAQQAVYSSDALGPLDEPLLKKYFLRGTGGMQGWVKVKPEISGLVQFRRINLQDVHWPQDVSTLNYARLNAPEGRLM